MSLFLKKTNNIKATGTARKRIFAAAAVLLCAVFAALTFSGCVLDLDYIKSILPSPTPSAQAVYQTAEPTDSTSGVDIVIEETPAPTDTPAPAETPLPTKTPSLLVL